MSDDEGVSWRQKLQVLRERPKPGDHHPKTSPLIPRSISPSSLPNNLTQVVRKHNRNGSKSISHYSSRSRSPDGTAADFGSNYSSNLGPRNLPAIQHAGADHMTAKRTNQPALCSHHVAILNLANDRESSCHVPSTGSSYVFDSYSVKGVPECLDTFSDFYNPTISADTRFEKYLSEMHRREKEIEAKEKQRIKRSSIGKFHSNKYGNKRNPHTLHCRKSNPINLPVLSSSTEEFSYNHQTSINGFSDNKKALAVSTFSLHDIDKRCKGIGVPHTTR